MKKKRILLAILVALISTWTIYKSIAPSYFSVLETNWGIELPVKAICKEVYSEDTGPSFHGDGIRYHVFSYFKSSEIEKMLPWSDVNGNTLAWSQTQGEEILCLWTVLQTGRWHRFMPIFCHTTSTWLRPTRLLHQVTTLHTAD